MKFRTKYWSNTSFADWIRGIKKGGAKTGRGWREWEQEGRRLYPIRFWIAEEGLDKVQNFFCWPVDRLYSIKYYINNRWITRTNTLTAHPNNIKPGTWCDVGNRFLPCLFNELVNFVEVELAWHHLVWNKKDRAKYSMPWWAVGWWRIRTWRCPQAGLDNLTWQSQLFWTEEECEEGSSKIGQPTPQAEKAMEILDLYKWWTQTYPNRPDPHDAGGWTAYCNMRNDRGDHMLDLEDRTPEEAAVARVALEKTEQIEQLYEQEDEQMMIRLIKIRNGLWT